MNFASLIKIACFFLLLFNTKFFPQTFKWENLSFGAVSGYSFTSKDLKEYWGNYASAGILIQYKISEINSFEAIISGAFLKDKKNISERIPDIFLINQFGGLKFLFPLKNNFSLNITPGLTNTTMVFKGKAAERSGDNYIESEFGVFISTGTAFNLVNPLWLEVCVSYQNVFTSPESLNLYHLGLKVIWN